jgi:predicted lipase
MKKFAAFCFLILSFNLFAESVFLFPNCNTYNGECTLVNTSGKDVNCTIQVRGQTKSGRHVSAFEYKTLYQGMFAWVRVNAYDINDPITYLQANASCNTIY